MVKNRNPVLLIFVSFFALLLFAQNDNNNKSVANSSCKDVINSLRELHSNDSIAISFFWEKYRIINKHDALLKKNYIEMIQYVNSEEGEDCFCQSKFIVKRIPLTKNVPLLDISKLPSDTSWIYR